MKKKYYMFSEDDTDYDAEFDKYFIYPEKFVTYEKALIFRKSELISFIYPHEI